MRSYFFASMAYVCCCAVPGLIAAQEIDLLGEKGKSPSASVAENSETKTEQIPLATSSVSTSDNVGETASRTVTVYSEAAMANQNAYVVQTPCTSCSSGNAGVEFNSNSGAVVQNSYANPVTYGGNQQGYVTENSYPQPYESGYSTGAPIENSCSTCNGGVAYGTPSNSTQQYSSPQYSTSNAGQVVYSGGSYPSNTVSSPATIYPSQSCSSCSQSNSTYPQGNVVYQQSAPVSYGSSNAIPSTPQYSSPASFEGVTNSSVEANYVPSSTYASSTYPNSSAPQYSTSQMTYTSSAPISSSVPTTSYSSSSPSYSTPQPSYSSRSSNGSCQPGLAQSKAVQAAQMRLQGHLGSGLGGAHYEGVGWSNQSAQQAIEHCCYWGQRPTAQIGVSKGSDGMWYACVLYY